MKLMMKNAFFVIWHIFIFILAACSSTPDIGGPDTGGTASTRYVLHKMYANAWVGDEAFVVRSDGTVVEEAYSSSGTRQPQYDRKYILTFNQTNTWVLDQAHKWDTGTSAWISPVNNTNHYRFPGIYTNSIFLSAYAFRKYSGPATGVDGYWVAERQQWDLGGAFPGQYTNMSLLNINGGIAGATNLYSPGGSGFYIDSELICTNFVGVGGNVYRFIHWWSASSAETNWYLFENGFLVMTNMDAVYLRVQ